MALAILVDPLALGAAARRATRLLRTRLGDELAVVPLEADEDTTAATRRALDVLHPRAVIALGGDAMITAVATALLDTPTALGIVPIGDDHSIARQLGLPLDIDAACEAVAALCDADHSRRIDVIRIGERVVLSRVVMGRLAELEGPRKRGVIARIRWGLGSLWGLFGPTARFDIEVDGEQIRMRANSVVVANTGAVGLAGLQWATDIAFDDGIVDVVVIRSSTLFDYLALLSSWLMRRERRRQSIHLRARARVHVRCSRVVAVRYDGVRERGAQLGAQVVRAGLRVLMPGSRPPIVEPAPTEITVPLPPVMTTELRAS